MRCVSALAVILNRDSQKEVAAKCTSLLVAILHYDTQLGEKLIQEEAMKNLCGAFVRLLGEVNTPEKFEKHEEIRAQIINMAAFVSG